MADDQGTDHMCQFELNRQMQGVLARLSAAENNITAHYIGMSRLCDALLATPAGSAGAVMKAFYDFENISVFPLYQKLIKLVDPAEFKALMMQSAAGLVNGMANELEGIAGKVIDNVTSTITDAMEAIESIGQEILNIEQQLLNSANLTQEEIDSLNTQLTDLTADLATQRLGLNRARDLLATSVSFLGSQKNAASCKVTTSIIG